MKTILLLSTILLLGLTACSSDAPINVTLYPTTLQLIVGQNATLTATITPRDAHNQQKTWESSNNSIASVNNGQVTANAPGTATITVRTADGSSENTATITVFTREQVTDEGVMIAGIRWATRNVDMPGTFAEHPESTGRFFQWGTLNGVVHHWAATGTVTGWSISNRVAWTSANDPCPPGWRVPTQEELTSLRDAIGDWTQQNGVNGRVFGTAPYQIFLPAAGLRHTNGDLDGVGSWGYYWSSTVTGDMGFSFTLYHVSGLNFSSGSSSVVSTNSHIQGFSVRCVSE